MFNKFKNLVVDNVKKAGQATSDATKKAKDNIVEVASVENVKKTTKAAADRAKNIVDAVNIENVKKVSKTAYDAVTVENLKNAGHEAVAAVTVENVKTVATYASGVKGYKELKESKRIIANAKELHQNSEKTLENVKATTNYHIQLLGEEKVDTVKKTVAVFVDCLKFLERKNKGKELKSLESIDIKKEEIKDIIDLSISTANLAKGAAGSVAIGATALLGTKAAVLGGVSAFASASTGTSIATLTGAAKANAVLAWLGGGAVTSGGGGVAVGTTVLAGITFTAMAGAALVTGGVLLSAHGSKALTLDVQVF